MSLVDDFVYQQMKCVNTSDSLITRDEGQLYCEPEFDSLICWKAAPANSIMAEPCPIPGVQLPPHALAYKNCSSYGNWTKTDYNICFQHIPDDKHIPNATKVLDEYEKYLAYIATVMSDIYFVFSIISVLFLLISIFIFIYFKSLHCHRITIHIHMFISFVIKFVILIVMVEPGVTKRTHTYKDYEWLCKTLIALREYGNTSNMYWMFVEGLYLHNQIAAAVFSTDAPFKLFCFIGWGLPGIIVLTWSIIMQLTFDQRCWNKYSQSNWIYLILIPFLLVILLNLLFLINIIRILVTKLRSNNIDESSRIKKTIRATIILFPLLGLTNIIFLYNPEDRGSLQVTYHITNAILQSTGGILLSVLYCFMNGEVKRVIRQKWTRFTIRRHLKGGRGRTRGSRASDFMLSQTEQSQLPMSSSHIAASSSSSDTTSGSCVNNNRYNKITTPIPEESLDETLFEIDKNVQTKPNDNHHVENDFEMEPLVDKQVERDDDDVKINVDGKNSLMNCPLTNHVERNKNLNNNSHIKINGGPGFDGVNLKRLHNEDCKKRSSDFDDGSCILPSAESFDRLHESVI